MAYLRIIEQIQPCLYEYASKWGVLAPTLYGSGAEIFSRVDGNVGGARRRQRFITVSFLSHLLRPIEIPIIDQHNFRAMNYYLSTVHTGWNWKSKPTQYGDLVQLAEFIRGVRSCWDHESCPSEQQLDRFLMIFGRELKKHSA